MAVSSVIAAFRTGLLVTDTARRVDPSQDLSESWAVLVPGQKASAMLKEFCDSHVSTSPHQAVVTFTDYVL
jgi:hypothetical protein